MDWIIALMDQFGYLGVGLLIAVENIFPPIPSEVVLAFGGFMTTYSSLGVWGVVLAATAGSVAGALALYWVGRMLSAERLEKWLGGKLGKVLHLRPDDVEKARVWFEKRGGKAVFLCRFVPIVRSLISIPAGMTRMNVPKFLALSTAGTFLWNLVLVNLGAFMGASWEKVADAIGVYASVALAAIAAAVLIAGFIFYKKRLAKKKETV